eukprot:638781-Rhodomonas_salina.1
MLRSAPRSYLRALYRLINMYLEGKPIQLDMKGALAVLLLKKEQREELQNHRPVCLMHVVTKMITTIVTDCIVSNINDNSLLEQGQEGGRAAH